MPKAINGCGQRFHRVLRVVHGRRDRRRVHDVINVARRLERHAHIVLYEFEVRIVQFEKEAALDAGNEIVDRYRVHGLCEARAVQVLHEADHMIAEKAPGAVDEDSRAFEFVGNIPEFLSDFGELFLNEFGHMEYGSVAETVVDWNVAVSSRAVRLTRQVSWTMMLPMKLAYPKHHAIRTGHIARCQIC